MVLLKSRIPVIFAAVKQKTWYMEKILAVIRSSSDKQETASQKAEMIEYCKSKGYNESNIEILEVSGASARKLNKKYLQMLETIKSTLLDNDIKAAAFWHLNRLGRNESKLIEMKDFFKKHQIQVYVKHPTIQLLNDDGSLNEGANISWSVFAVMVEKETEEMFAKLSRGKRSNAMQGKYNGSTLLLGYALDENQYYIVDEQKAQLVRLIFNLYATGKYSANTLAVEMTNRGYPFKEYQILNIIQNTAYIGYTNYDGWKRSHRVYPRIITDELYNQCAAIRLKNNTCIDKTKQLYLGSKLIRCPECNANYVYQMYGLRHKRLGGVYTCWRHGRKDLCSNKLSINTINLDRMLWFVAKAQHINYTMSMDKDKINDIKAEIKLLKQKIDVAVVNKSRVDGKISKIVDSYVEGLINKEQRDSKISKVKEESQQYDVQIAEYKNKIENFQLLINNISKNRNMLDKILNAYESILAVKQEMYDIVHMHIQSVVLNNSIVDNKYCVHVTIYPTQGKQIIFNYFPNNKAKTSNGNIDRFFIDNTSMTDLIYQSTKDYDKIYLNQ